MACGAFAVGSCNVHCLKAFGGIPQGLVYLQHILQAGLNCPIPNNLK